MSRVRVPLVATLCVLTLVVWLPVPAAAAAISGVTLRLDEAPTNRVRLRFEVCGADVTQLPGTGLPVTFGFDTPVVHLGVHVGRPSLAPEVHVTGHAATVSLRRDPFSPPEPWRIVIRIDVAQLPTTGGLTLGAWPAHDLAPALAAVSGEARVVVGVGCDDLYATPESPPGTPVG
jgi:hypothetical protein